VLKSTRLALRFATRSCPVLFGAPFYSLVTPIHSAVQTPRWHAGTLARWHAGTQSAATQCHTRNLQPSGLCKACHSKAFARTKMYSATNDWAFFHPIFICQRTHAAPHSKPGQGRSISHHASHSCRRWIYRLPRHVQRCRVALRQRLVLSGCTHLCGEPDLGAQRLIHVHV